MCAAAKGRTETVGLLLEKGADIEANDKVRALGVYDLIGWLIGRLNPRTRPIDIPSNPSALLLTSQ